MIVLPEDELKHLEKTLGPHVRQMGTWSSDGVFGFCAVPIAVVEKAAEAVGHPSLAAAVERLKMSDNRTQPFIEIVHAFGPTLVKEIAATYRERVGRSYTHRQTRTASNSAA